VRVEIVHKGGREPGDPAAHWARIKGDNGEIVWVTEQYTEARTAHEAVGLLAAGFGMGGGVTGTVEGQAFKIHEVWE
jgi:hypothetical protein